MINLMRGYALVIGIGVVTAAAWSFGFSKIHYFIYQVLGSPENPTTVLWTALLVQSFLMGAIPGILIPFVSRRATQPSTLVFILAICLSIISVSLVFGGIQAVVGLVTSIGVWALLIGAAIGCLGAGYAKNAT